MKNKLLFFIFNFAFLILNSELTQAANYYWVGGTGNWSNYAVHWATTSGGNVFHVQVPTSFDNVYFDANSFTAPGQIITNDTTIAYCRDMDWTGATNNPVYEAANTSIELKIFGSLTLNAAVNFSFNGSLTFASFNQGNTIQTFSEMLQCPIGFNGAGGEWTLLDSLSTTSAIVLTYGTLRTNNNNIKCYSFYSNSNNSRALYLGTSTVRVLRIGSYSWNVTSSLLLDADSSIIHFRDGGYFYSLGHVYNILQWDSTALNPPFYNILEGENFIINKVISLNSSPYSDLWFEYTTNIWVDSVIDKGQLQMYVMGGLSYFNYIWVNHSAEIREEFPDTIMKIIVDENLEFSNGANHFIHDATVGGNLTISQGSFSYPNSQTFDSCRVFGNATILSGSNHLGIFTMTPGKTLTLKNDSIQYIDSLSATGTPGFPIQIISSDLGLAANVVIQEDLCTNYLYIHAVHANSPNLLFVGPNSNDVANNTGWIFTNCLPTEIEENHSGSLTLFPNPAVNELYVIGYSLSGKKEIEIYDAVGQKVFSQPQTTNHKLQTAIDISYLKPGIYFVKIKSDQSEHIAKFVKQ